jgi:hypothetical protein
VTILDILTFKPVFNTHSGQPSFDRRWDLNADGAVALLDILLMKPHFNMHCA